MTMDGWPVSDDDLTHARHMAFDQDGEQVRTLPPTPDAPIDPTLVQWARFRDLFAAELSGSGFWTLDDLERRIATRQAFFFPGRKAALIGMIEAYPGGERAFKLLLMVGDTAESMVILPGVEALARMMGCTSMLVSGRPAWKRLLMTAGYEPWTVTLHKGLTDE